MPPTSFPLRLSFRPVVRRIFRHYMGVGPHDLAPTQRRMLDEEVRESRTLRYRFTIDEEAIRSLAVRAATNKGGRAKSGPVTVVVHPADRVRVEAEHRYDEGASPDVHSIHYGRR